MLRSKYTWKMVFSVSLSPQPLVLCLNHYSGTLQLTANLTTLLKQNYIIAQFHIKEFLSSPKKWKLIYVKNINHFELSRVNKFYWVIKLFLISCISMSCYTPTTSLPHHPKKSTNFVRSNCTISWWWSRARRYRRRIVDLSVATF